MTEPFPLIELRGSPEARGRLYGQQAAARIHRSIGHYAAQLAASGHGAERVRGWARDFVPRIEAFDADFVAEMRGIATGANVPFEDIVLINARTEVLQLGKRSTATAVSSSAQELMPLDSRTRLPVRASRIRSGWLVTSPEATL